MTVEREAIAKLQAILLNPSIWFCKQVFLEQISSLKLLLAACLQTNILLMNYDTIKDQSQMNN